MPGAILASLPVIVMELSYLIIAMMDEEPTVVFGRSVSYVKVGCHFAWVVRVTRWARKLLTDDSCSSQLVCFLAIAGTGVVVHVLWRLTNFRGRRRELIKVRFVFVGGTLAAWRLRRGACGVALAARRLRRGACGEALAAWRLRRGACGAALSFFGASVPPPAALMYRATPAAQNVQQLPKLSTPDEKEH